MNQQSYGRDGTSCETTSFGRPSSTIRPLRRLFVGTARGPVAVGVNEDVRLDVWRHRGGDLASLSTLRTDDIQLVDLSGSNVTDSELLHIARLTGLMSLNLEQTQITDEAIKHLAGLRELRQLDLDEFLVSSKGFGVSDGAMAVLAQPPKLELPNIRRTNITDLGLRHLRGNESIRGLVLGQTG